MRPSILAFFFSLLAFHLLSHDHKKGLEYVENRSQWNTDVKYRCELGDGTVYLENSCLTYTFMDSESSARLHDLKAASEEEQDAAILYGHAWKMHFVDAGIPTIRTLEKSSHYYNYFIGAEEDSWSSKIHGYGSVVYSELYPGVDMVFHGEDGNFKYDFIAHPGADVGRIVLQFDGLESLDLREGQLVLGTSIGEFMESRPYVYQMVDGKTVEVECQYSLSGDVVTFDFPNGYNEGVDLVIDPELIASTLSGTAGGSSHYGHCASFDIEGNIYTGCTAGGDNYPSTTGAFSESYGGGGWDIGISKLSPDGSELIWASFFGGSQSDYPHSLIINTSQELYIYGSTHSTDYPTTANSFQSNSGGGTDIIITHVSADGSALVGSTYLGGSETDGQNANSFNYGDTFRGEIYLDHDEDPIVATCSNSSDFPVLPNAYQSTIGGEQDAVIVRLDPSLTSLSMSTFLGGPENDTGYSIRTAIDGSMYIGGSGGEDFPTTAGAYQTAYQGGGGGYGFGEVDGFIAKLDEAGTELLNSTLFGTSSTDQIFFIDLDFDENIFAFGQGGTDIPVVGEVYVNEDSQQFVAKFDPTLSTLLTSTTIGDGPNNTMVPDAFLVDNCDNIYLSSYNAFGNLETTDDALFETGGFYLAVYEQDMAEIIFGTFYTGGHVDGGTSRFDKNGMVYQAVCSGGGFSTTDDAWATDQDTSWDMAVFKIDFDASGVNAAVAGNDIIGCTPFEITFENFSIGDQFHWDFGDGSISDEYEPTYVYTDPGVYSVSLIAMDSLSCNLADTSYFDIIVSTPQDFTPSFDYEIDCSEQSIILDNTTDLDFLDYIWDMGDGNTVVEYETTYYYEEPGDYVVSLLAVDNGCDADEELSVNITIEPSVDAQITASGTEGCDELETIFSSASANATSYSWDFGNGVTSTEEGPTQTFIGPAEYEVILTAFNSETCNGSDTDTMIIDVGAVQDLQALFDLVQTSCVDFTVVSDNQSTGINVDYIWNMGDGSPNLTGENIEHDYPGEGTYDVILTVTDPHCDIQDQITLPITITSEVVAQILLDDLIGCETYPMEFQHNGLGEATWDFGDGSPTVTGDVVTHIYPLPGSYTVTLTVVADGECSGTDETTSEVEIIEPFQLIADFDVIQTGECADYTFEVVNTSVGPIDSYEWDTGDGNTYIGETPDIVYDEPGEYVITLNVGESVCDISEQATQAIQFEDMTSFSSGPDVHLCYHDESIALDAGVEDAQYLWSNGDTLQITQASPPGGYEVDINESGCWFSDSVYVIGVPQVILEKVEVQCKGEENVVTAPYVDDGTYLWENGVEESYLFVEETGVYHFVMTDPYGCEHPGMVDIELTPDLPTVYIPNSFTPNSDGLNDQFVPVTGDLVKYELMVFDRWGKRIFHTTDVDEIWDGGVQGGESYYIPDDIYTYTVEYRSTCSSETIREKGSITVVR